MSSPHCIPHQTLVGFFLSLGSLLFGATQGLTAANFLGTTQLLQGPAAGADSVVLAVASPTEPWTATSHAPWLHVDAAHASGTNSGNVVFTFDDNPGATRTGNLTVAGATLEVTQAGSTYVPGDGVTTLVTKSGSPRGIAVDAAGNVYFGEYSTQALKRWEVATGNVTTLRAEAGEPVDLALDKAGNLHFPDDDTEWVLTWNAVDGIVDPFVGLPPGRGYAKGVAVDPAGNVYVADILGGAVYRYAPDSGTRTKLFSSDFSGDAGPAADAGVAVDAAGNVYVADAGNRAVRKWTAASGTLTTLFTTPSSLPRGIAVDGSGNVFVTDTSRGAILKWAAASGETSEPVPTGLRWPHAVAVSAGGNVYIADTHNGAIKMLQRAFVDGNPVSAPASAGNGHLAAVVPATAQLAGAFAPTSDQPWLKVTGATDGRVGYEFTANAGATRTGHIAVLGKSIAVVQSGGFTMTLSEYPPFLGGSEGSGSVTLNVSTSDGAWTATSSAPWLQVSANDQSGSGSGKVSFSFPANPGAPRAASLSIGGQNLNFIQYSTLPDALGTFTLLEGPLAGADSVSLRFYSSPGPWIAAANDSWLHLDAAHARGTGSTPVVFTFDANPGATRTGTLTVAGMTLTVTQAGSTYVAAGRLTPLVSPGTFVRQMALDVEGNIYFPNQTSNSIRRWNRVDGTITTPISQGLKSPQGVALDSEGNVYIADLANKAIKKWTAADRTLTTLVSDTEGTPSFVAVDTSGNVYFYGFGSQGIHQWTAATGALRTVAPTLFSILSVDISHNLYGVNIQGTVGRWNVQDSTFSFFYDTGRGTTDIAVDGSGNTYFADLFSVKRWSAVDGTVATVVEANPKGEYVFALSVDAAGNLYAAYTDKVIRMLPRAFVDPSGITQMSGGGGGVLPGILPSDSNLSGPFVPVSDQAWLTIDGITNGVVRYSITANATGVDRTAHLNVLGVPIPITQTAGPEPVLTRPIRLANGDLQFGFSGNPTNSYSVRFSTQVERELSEWLPLGSATLTTQGEYQFIVTPSPTAPIMFYRVVSP